MVDMASGCIQSIKWSMKYIGHDEISNRKARDIKAQKMDLDFQFI